MLNWVQQTNKISLFTVNREKMKIDCVILLIIGKNAPSRQHDNKRIYFFNRTFSSTHFIWPSIVFFRGILWGSNLYLIRQVKYSRSSKVILILESNQSGSTIEYLEQWPILTWRNFMPVYSIYAVEKDNKKGIDLSVPHFDANL